MFLYMEAHKVKKSATDSSCFGGDRADQSYHLDALKKRDLRLGEDESWSSPDVPQAPKEGPSL